MLNSIKDLLGVSRVASAYALSNIVKFPEGERYQINTTTYLKCMSSPQNAIGNVLILQGGVLHFNSNSYYIKTTCSLLPNNLRVFVFEKIQPMCCYRFAHDVASCLTFIRREYPEPICVIGFSLGGVLLYTYLSLGYDQADLYLPVCCPLNLTNFRKVISQNFLFKILQKRAYDKYQVTTNEELLNIAGTSLEESLEFEESFIDNLNATKENWVAKTVYILSSDDPVTRVEDLELLEEKPLTYLINGSWHCDLESILLSVMLVGKFMRKEELLPNYGMLDVIRK